MVANVMSVSVAPGDQVAVGDTVALLESATGDVVQEGDVLLALTV